MTSEDVTNDMIEATESGKLPCRNATGEPCSVERCTGCPTHPYPGPLTTECVAECGIAAAKRPRMFTGDMAERMKRTVRELANDEASYLRKIREMSSDAEINEGVIASQRETIREMGEAAAIQKEAIDAQFTRITKQETEIADLAAALYGEPVNAPVKGSCECDEGEWDSADGAIAFGYLLGCASAGVVGLVCWAVGWL